MPVYSQQTFYFSTFLFMLPYFKDVSLSIISMQFHSFFSLFASCHFTPNKLYISLNLSLCSLISKMFHSLSTQSNFFLSFISPFFVMLLHSLQTLYASLSLSLYAPLFPRCHSLSTLNIFFLLYLFFV